MTGHASVVSVTPRQREVVALLALGFCADEIAERLAISTRTVRAHRHPSPEVGCHARTHDSGCVPIRHGPGPDGQLREW